MKICTSRVRCRSIGIGPLDRLLLSGLALCVIGVDAFAESYDYDTAGRLTSVTFDDGSSIAYAYDPAGNITSARRAIGVLPPDGEIDMPELDVAIIEGESVDFAGTGFDPDMQLPLTYLWEFDGAAPDSTQEDPGPVTFTTAGTYEVRFTVTDAVGLKDPTPPTRTIAVGAAPDDGAGGGGSGGGGGGGGGSAGLVMLLLLGLVAASRRRSRRLALAVTMLLLLPVAHPLQAQEWRQLQSGTSVDLNGIWGASSTNVFAVGDAGTILRFDGNAWSPMNSGTPSNLNAVYGTAADDVYAVGDNATILHFDGTSWSPFSIPARIHETGAVETEAFVDVWTGGAGQNVWVITNLRAFWYDGSAWQQRGFVEGTLGTYAANTELRAFIGFYDSSALERTIIVGRPRNSTGSPIYTDFRTMTSPAPSMVASGVFAIAPDDMYVAARASSSVRFTGGDFRDVSDWTRITIMSDPTDVWGGSSNSVFAVGRDSTGVYGQIAQYDGNATNSWNVTFQTANTELSSVWGFSDSDVFVVGGQGAIYRLTAGEPLLTSANYPNSGWLTDHINGHTGELVLRATDMDLGGLLPVTFSRYYASGLRDTLPTVGALGRNWSHTYEWRVDVGAATIRFYSPRGRRIEFSDVGGNWELTTDIGAHYQLDASALPASVSLLEEETGLTYSFGTSPARLESIRDRVGNALSVNYTPNFVPPTSVSDGARTLFLQYNASLELVSIGSGVAPNLKTVAFEHANGNLTAVTDANQETTRYSYDADATLGRITAITTPAQRTPFTWAYDANSGKVASITEATGRTLAVTEQSGTTPARVAAPDGSTVGMTHDDRGRVTSLIDEDGFATTYTYSPENRVATLVDKTNETVRFTYDAASGEMTSLTGPDGLSMTYRYASSVSPDGFSYTDLVGVDHPDQTSTSIDRSANGLVTAIVDRNNQRWEYAHDASGNVVSHKPPGGGVYTMTYSSDDTLATVEDPSGNITSYRYDAFRRLAAVALPGTDNLTQLLEYDSSDRLTAITDEAGNRTSVDYTPDGSISSVDLPTMNPIVREFDPMGRIAAVTSPDGDRYEVRYDDRGRPSEFEGPDGDIETWSYDNVNHASGVRIGTRPTWQVGYDAEGIPQSFTLPDTTLISLDSSDNPVGRITNASQNGTDVDFDFDSLGRLTAVGDEGGNRSTLEFNGPAGRLDRLQSPDPAVDAEFGYDPTGRLTQIIDANGASWARAFDASGRLARLIDPLNREVLYEYDGRNRVNRIEFPGGLGSVDLVLHPLGPETERNFSSGESISFEYDELGRLTAGTGLDVGFDANGNMSNSNDIAMSYDAEDRLQTIEFAPGRAVTYVYDDRGRVIGVQDWLGGTAVGFEHDELGRVRTMRRSNGVDTQLDYDALGRLTGIEVPGVSSIGLSLDTEGRITAAQRAVPRPAGVTDASQRTYTHDAASQVNEFDYDQLGRRTADDRHTFSWRMSTRLDSYTSSTSSVSFEYDAVGLRTQRTEGARTIDYVWNYALGLPSISAQREEGADVRYFVHTPAGDLLYSIESDGSRRFYHYDENGNTLYVTDDAGGVLASYAYSPYGELLASAGTIENPFTFVGQRGVMREADGLYYMRARYFDAVSGRFLTRDPVQGAAPTRVNPYQYAQGNPIEYRDPSGMDRDGRELSFFARAKNWFIEKAQTINNGLSGHSLWGVRWEVLGNEAMAPFVRSRQQVANAIDSASRRGRALSPLHNATYRGLRSIAPPVVKPPPLVSPLVDEIFFGIKNQKGLPLLSGLVAAVTENSDEFTSTRGGEDLGKAGVFATNTLANTHPASAALTGLSTILDVSTQWLTGDDQARLGLHEVAVNAAPRALTAVTDDLLFNGRSIFDKHSSTRAFIRDSRANRGAASNYLSEAGGDGRMIDVLARANPVLYGTYRTTLAPFKDSIYEGVTWLWSKPIYYYNEAVGW